VAAARTGVHTQLTRVRVHRTRGFEDPGRGPAYEAAGGIASATDEVLEEEWLKAKGMTQTALTGKMGLHVQVVNGIVQGRRAVTAKTALLLARALDTTPQFWLNL